VALSGAEGFGSSRAAIAARWNSQLKTVIYIRKRYPTDANYVVFRPIAEGISRAWVGMKGAAQLVRISFAGAARLVATANKSRAGSADVAGVITHEMGHMIGLLHEHQRPDRNSYVKVDWENVEGNGASDCDGTLKNRYGDFCTDSDYGNPRDRRCLPCQHDFLGKAVGKYDYDSIMHYFRYHAAKDESKPTITALRDPNKPLGWCKTPSDGDLDAVRYLYK
jgi:hypothetical protein